ncbi:MAG: hypothetical protein KME16_23305 [Scytolyngbya sp. HA4215-MV1]|jgi:hypothetical protein|nr:hypothetical protein [Scytolyngbya sp. HA4215-MV1]
MAIVLTPTEINQFRQELANLAPALIALEMVEACEGDLEDAAISLAIRVGQEPDTSERWLEGVAKRWRHIICQLNLPSNSQPEQVVKMVKALTENTDIPPELVTPVALYVFKAGVNNFCQPLSAKLV